MNLSKYQKLIYNWQPFYDKVKRISKNLKIEPEWLLDVMYIETAGTFSPSIKNKSSSATGLIQFMASTAQWLGTSTAQLSVMSNLQQLDYVEKYFVAQFKTTGVPKSFFDLYCVVFYPKWVNSAETSTLADSAYAVNKGIDLNKDGKITKGEFRVWANRQVNRSATDGAIAAIKKGLPFILLPLSFLGLVYFKLI